MSGPYRVEIDDPGCSGCQHGQTFWVIGPDDVASSTSYGDREDADALKAACDHAYELGRNSVAPPVSVAPQVWTSFEDNPLPEPGILIIWDAEFKCLASMYWSGPDDIELARKNRYTHWISGTAFRGPVVPATEQQPAQPMAEVPTLQPAPGSAAGLFESIVPAPGATTDNTWPDDMPF